MLDYVAQGLVTVLLLGTGNWFTGLLHLGMSIYMAKLFFANQHRVDATGMCGGLHVLKAMHLCMLRLGLLGGDCGLRFTGGGPD